MSNTLCIDIGGTRIKSAVLPQNPTLEKVLNAPSVVISTLGWLNYSLPKLLDHFHPGSLASFYRDAGVTYDSVAVSVPGPVDAEGNFLRADLVKTPAKVPKNLKESMERVAGCPVSLIKDADAWAMGFKSYANLNGDAVDYPAVILTFGTGFGLSALDSSGCVMSIEASARPGDSWKLLSKAASKKILFGFQTHGIVGKPFFKWVEDDRKEWDFLEMRAQFTERVTAAVQDLRPWLEKNLDGLRTVVLAGGNAEYISVPILTEKTGLKVISLANSLNMLKSELVTVLGVEASVREKTPTPIN